MKNVPFLKELTESRLFQRPKDLGNMSAKEIGEIIYLTFMMLEMLRWEKPSVAREYANNTLKNNPFDMMYYSATDLSNLLSVLNHQEAFAGHIKVDSKISIPLYQITRYLRDVASSSNRASGSEDQSFFWRLEDYLKVYGDSLFRKLRRDIGNWTSLTYADKVHYTMLMRREFDKRGSSMDLYLWFKSSFKLHEDITTTKTKLTEYSETTSDKEFDTKLAYNKVLNPALWNADDELHDDVKDALAKIANKFAEFIDVKQLRIIDYVITGSNCAFNYTSQSDVDLHVLVDTSNLGDNPLTDPFLQAKKSLWNSGHDITVKGYTVELYAEDISNDDNKLVASGVYSLLRDTWIKKPSYEDITIDDYAVQAKAKDIMASIERIIASETTDKREIDDLWVHIRKMRRSGLEKGGEFSVENLAFKAIRNNGYFDRLREYEKNLEDEELTLEQTTEEIVWE